ncbi:MAG: peptidoglycan-binding protein [Alphaproteobacteria bacterium]|nr:peptidoglycan-binding protein [Alphaproteobacteria bacterium]
MTASTLSHLPLAAGSALAGALGRTARWALSHYMRAPLASTGLMAMVTLTALAGSNALYFQTMRHPAPFFSPTPTAPLAVVPQTNAPVLPVLPTERSSAPAPAPAASTETTGSVTTPTVIPDQPVGNKQAFAVQKKLAELGLFQGTLDGFYGPRTANAIRAFEERNGLAPTGAMTPPVVDAILNSDAGGRMPLAQTIAPPVTQTVAAVQPQPTPVVVQQPVVVPAQRMATQQAQTLTPVDNVVDVVGNAAESTIDSIVAAFDSSPATPLAPRATLPAISNQPRPATSLTSQPPAVVQQLAPVVQQVAATTPAAAPVDPANNAQLVGQIQRGLASLGFYHGTIDGHPGDATARAIREFENFNSYKLTGQVKPDLVVLLRNAGATI